MYIHQNIATDARNEGAKDIAQCLDPSRDTHSSQSRGVRGHSCEGRLIGLRDIHDEDIREDRQSKSLDHRKEERKEKSKVKEKQ